MSPGREPDGSKPVYEVTFTTTAVRYPFVRASRAMGCRFELAEMVPRMDGRYAEFFRVHGADPADVADLAGGHGSADVTRLQTAGADELLEFEVGEDCPAVTLAELGALPRGVHSADGEGRITAEVPPQYDPSTVVEAFQTETAGMELVTKREKSGLTPLFAESAVEQVLRTRLTDRQREVLEAAYEAGYYAWPQETTGSEVAASLDISSTTFSEHIHAAERKLLGVLFEERSSGSGRP